MTKAELRALAEMATGQKKVTVVPSGHRAMTEREMYLKAHASDEELRELELQKKAQRRRQEEEDDRPRITVVTDHAGREFYRNEAGEWL